MMNFIRKVGNIEVYTEKNSEREITATLINGSDVILKEVYFAHNESAAIDDLLRKIDIYTAEWIKENIKITDVTILSENTYRAFEKDYFCRIDDTKYFKHYFKSADEFITDKNGMRIIDR